MLFNLNRFAAATVAALTFGTAFVAGAAQKASAQISGIGSKNVGDFLTKFGVNYTVVGSDVCASGTVPDGYDLCGTDIPFGAADGYTQVPIANLRIEAPVNGGDTGLSQDDYCAIIRGEVTTFSDGTPITVVYRLPGSGTGFIVNNVCGADGSQVPGAIGVGSSGAVVSTVQSTPGAIGYAEQANLNGTPSALGSPITGPIYVIFSTDNGNASDFINIILSNP